MGRYYNGDIEGKFWFGVQSSNDADFFGSVGESPALLEYYFDKEEHEESINKGIKECVKQLGEHKEKIDAFFKDNTSYNDAMLVDVLGVSEKQVRNLLEWYARLSLGLEIKECVDEHGSCSFEAEC